MSKQSVSRGEKKGTTLGHTVGAKAARKLQARRNPTESAWLGLGMMGLVGWSVVVPTLLGAACGVWLDNQYPGSHSWTPALLVAGLVIGCLNAWHWVARENATTRDGEENSDE